MKKSIKIVSMTDFNGSPKKADISKSTPRRGLVQGTLDIVTPRSPIQSCESVPISSPASIISSKNSYMEDAHATPRRDNPKISMCEEPQPERPSTSLELSEEETETCESQRAVNLSKHHVKSNRIPWVDARGSRGAVEVALSFGSGLPSANVQRHVAQLRPFGDASNLPVLRSDVAGSPVPPPTKSLETQASPHLGHFALDGGEENRKSKESDDSFSKSGIPSPKMYNKQANASDLADLPGVTFRDTQSSPSVGLTETVNSTQAREDSLDAEKPKKTKKKKTGRVVESRFMRPPPMSSGPSLSMSISSVGRPLLNSTAMDATLARSSVTGATPSARPKRQPVRSATEQRLSSPATLPGRRQKKPVPGSREKPPEKEKPVPGSREKPPEKEKPVVAGATCSSKKHLACTAQELDLLYTLYMQFAYLNALADGHSRQQEEQFQAEFGVLCEAYRERQEKLVTLRQELLYWRSVHALEESITAQISALEPLLALFPEFSSHFSHVAAALDRTRHRLALKDLVLPSEEQLSGWQAELAREAGRSGDILNQVLSESPLNLGHLESLGDIVEQLVAMKARHQQLFEVARDIIGRAEALFAEEASLRIYESQERAVKEEGAC